PMIPVTWASRTHVTRTPVGLPTTRVVRRTTPPKRSDRIRAPLARADAKRVVDGRDEDFSVADPTGPRRLDDRLDDRGGLGIVHQDLELHLGQELHAILGAAVELGVALLPAEAFGLGDRDAGHAHLVERVLYLVELEGLDDGFDLLQEGPSGLDEATAMPSCGRVILPCFPPDRRRLASFPAAHAHECGICRVHCRSARVHADRQVPKARMLVAPGPFRPAVELDRRETRDQLLVQDAELEPREVRSQTEVHAVPEAQMRVRLARRAEDPGVAEDALVAVRRSLPEDDLVARRDRLPRQQGGARRRPPVVCRRARPADHLLDGAREERGT